jgi:peptidoglycan-associated lipoprotein
VKKYLVNLGLSGDKLRTVSYGEERPLNRASTEEAWAQNRRAEFVITNP